MSKKDKKCCGDKKSKKCCDSKKDKKCCVDKKSRPAQPVDCSCGKLTLVKWNYDNQPEEWKLANPNPYEKTHFVLLGEIKKMPRHLLCLEMETGKPHVFHTEDVMPLSKEEV